MTGSLGGTQDDARSQRNLLGGAGSSNQFL